MRSGVEATNYKNGKIHWFNFKYNTNPKKEVINYGQIISNNNGIEYLRITNR